MVYIIHITSFHHLSKHNKSAESTTLFTFTLIFGTPEQLCWPNKIIKILIFRFSLYYNSLSYNTRTSYRLPLSLYFVYSPPLFCGRNYNFTSHTEHVIDDRKTHEKFHKTYNIHFFFNSKKNFFIFFSFVIIVNVAIGIREKLKSQND